MAEISLVRLYLLRAMYLFVSLGLVVMVWPGILGRTTDWPLMNGVVSAMLAAVSILAAIGIRYPLQMLPVLMFEFLWKAVWLIAFALPLWTAGRMDARTMQSVIECLYGVILIPAVLPWRYLLAAYVKRPSDRWSGSAAAAAV